MCGVVETLVVAGTLISGISSFSQQRAQAKQAKNNAVIATQKAEDARKRGLAEKRKQEIKTALLIGKQRAAAAENQIVTDVGSALQIQEDTAAFGRQDALQILNNAEREALGFEAQASNFRAEAKQARAGAAFTLAGTLVSAATPVAKKWLVPGTTGGTPAFQQPGFKPVTNFQ